MATITLTVPDAVVQRVRNAFCYQYGYRDEITPGVPNPENKTQFMKRILLRIIKTAVKEYEAAHAADTARMAAEEAAEREIMLT